MFSIGNVQLKTNLLLAPIAGYCDLAFRLITRKITGPSGGVGLACTDLLCPQAILRKTDTTMWLASTNTEDTPVCMQLYGANPQTMAQAAIWAQDHGAATIDINMGCPVDKVTKKNGGSMLLCQTNLAIDCAKAIINAVNIPVTAKIRLGWDDAHFITQTLPTALADVGIAAVTVHGRTTQQKFRGHVRLPGIAQVVQSIEQHHPNIPVIGNGDIKSPEDAKHMIDQTGCHAVMIGRGALGQPWIFRDTAHFLKTGKKLQPLTQLQIAQIVWDHFTTHRQLRDDRQALIMIRKRMTWYSKYLQPWPLLRRTIHRMKSANAFEDYWLKSINMIKAGITLPKTQEAQETLS